MKWEELYKIVKENTDLDFEDRDWQEVFEYETIDKDAFNKIIEHYDLETSYPLRNSEHFIWVSDNKHKLLIYTEDGTIYDSIKDVDWWIQTLQLYDLPKYFGIEIEDIYNPAIGCTLNDARKNPGTLYHYCSEERWEEYQKKGCMFPEYGTGLTNRHINGVFTSTDPEEYADGTYGPICLAINMEQYKKDNNLEEVDLSFEPDIEDSLKEDYIHAALQLGEYNSHFNDSGMSFQTLIIGHSVPLKYVQHID
jgi:hypothetical protein